MHRRIKEIARTPTLLLAVDFDGTLAPIVPHPEDATGDPHALSLLRRAAALPFTIVAIVSGRALADLRARTPPIDGLWLVGGHGAEISGPLLQQRADDLTHILDDLAARLKEAAPPSAGFVHEPKPTGIAVHYRAVDEPSAAAALKSIVESIAPSFSLHVRHGKKVVELLAPDTDKGRALNTVRALIKATATIYLGDDVTDEDAFKVMAHTDLGVKVGAPPTAAAMCVPDLPEAHEIIADLVREREAWLGPGAGREA